MGVELGAHVVIGTQLGAQVGFIGCSHSSGLYKSRILLLLKVASLPCGKTALPHLKAIRA